jgi:hypothetical protein
MNSRRVTGAWIGFALASLAAGVYGQTYGHEFLFFDDFEYVTHNPHVLGGLTVGFQIYSPPPFHNHSPPCSPVCVTG